MAEEKIDVELQDTGEFLASIHTRMRGPKSWCSCSPMPRTSPRVC
jgi:hypothetical protein